MNQLTNNSGIPLAMAVWLAHDEYDHNPDPNTISATTIMKPLKQIILEQRVPAGGVPEDISSLVASRIGTALHNSVEETWTKHFATSMKRLGYPKRVIERIVINPDAAFLKANEDCIPVYMEQRASRTLNGITITGKYDFVAEGRVQDIKTTGVYTYIHKTNDKKYALQGSIYRWLNPDIITDDFIDIQFIFLDWKGFEANMNKNYPPRKVMPYRVRLLSMVDTERYLRQKIDALLKLNGADEKDLPPCNDDELWRKPPITKYFKNPKSTKRSTKNFTGPAQAADAYQRFITDGSVGLVKEIKGKVVACKYCNSFIVCKQKDAYLADGSLEI